MLRRFCYCVVQHQPLQGTSMPRGDLVCVGPPNLSCPHKARGDCVHHGFGDLDLCRPCEKVRRDLEYGQTVVKSTVSGGASNTPRNESENQASGDEPVDHSPFLSPTAFVSGTFYGQDILIQPVISYAVFSMTNSSKDNIRKAIEGQFDINQVIEAKEALWKHCGSTVIGEFQRRKGSTSRTEKQAHITDILDSLETLDKAEKMPIIAINAYSLGAIPRSHPEELNNVSLLDRLNKYEARMGNMETVMEKLVSNVTVPTQGFPKTYAKIASEISNNTGETRNSGVQSAQSLFAQSDAQNSTSVTQNCSCSERDTD